MTLDGILKFFNEGFTNVDDNLDDKFKSIFKTIYETLNNIETDLRRTVNCFTRGFHGNAGNSTHNIFDDVSNCFADTR